MTSTSSATASPSRTNCTRPCHAARPQLFTLRAGAFCVVHSAGRHVEFERGEGLRQMVEVAQPIVRCGEVCGVDRHCVSERWFPEPSKRRLRFFHWEIVDQGHENSYLLEQRGRRSNAPQNVCPCTDYFCP